MNRSLKAHIGSQTASALYELEPVLLGSDPLEMHKTRFEKYLKARLAHAKAGEEAVLIELIESWQKRAREIKRTRRAVYNK